MVIVLPKNPAWSLREQLRRLAARRPDLAVLLGLNLIALSALCVVLSLGPAFLAVILSNQDQAPWWVAAALLALVGLGLSRRIAKLGSGLLLQIAGTMVTAASEVEGESLPRLTAMERGGLRQAKEYLEDFETALASPGAMPEFPAMREDFIRRRQQLSPLFVRRNIDSRLELIEMVLTDAGQSQAADAGVYSIALYNLSREARAAIARVLNGKPPSAGAATWPNSYSQKRIDDRVNHGGEPVALRRLVEETDSWETL